MIDLLLIETGNGGDLLLTGNDLEAVTGYENMPYIAMFGGADWWANDLIIEPTQKMQSQTEAALMSNALTSAGRVNIIRAIEADLAFLKDEGAKITVTATITSPDRLETLISIDGEEIYMNWQPSGAFLNYKV